MPFSEVIENRVRPVDTKIIELCE